MLLDSDIDALDLAHTYAQSAKKKNALEVVFISLYEKYKAGITLEKSEERVVKDYLAVYRSEFALLKKKAKMKNYADKIIDLEAKKQAQEVEKNARLNLEEMRLALEVERQTLQAEKSEFLKAKASFDQQKLAQSKQPVENQNSSVTRAATIAYTSMSKFIVKNLGLSFNFDSNWLVIFLMMGYGFIKPEDSKFFINSYGAFVSAGRKALRLNKKLDTGLISVIFWTSSRKDFFGKTRILPIILYQANSAGATPYYYLPKVTTKGMFAKEYLDYYVNLNPTASSLSGVDYSNVSDENKNLDYDNLKLFSDYHSNQNLGYEEFLLSKLFPD